MGKKRNFMGPVYFLQGDAACNPALSGKGRCGFDGYGLGMTPYTALGLEGSPFSDLLEGGAGPAD
jgi:hypothetical protein